MIARTNDGRLTYGDFLIEYDITREEADAIKRAQARVKEGNENPAESLLAALADALLAASARIEQMNENANHAATILADVELFGWTDRIADAQRALYDA